VSRDALYLQHVLDAVGKVERYVAVGHAEFMAVSHWQDAVIRQLEIIGEAVKRISPDTLGRRPDIPWRRVSGLRDFLIHEYMGVDLEAIWQVTQSNVPELRQAVEELLGYATRIDSPPTRLDL
jgi:uncharacterized protein with HEPN domain